MSDGPATPRPEGDAPPPPPPVDTRRRVLLPTVFTLAALLLAGAVFTNVWTDRLWFDSVGYSDVFSTVLLTRIGLFASFGLLFAVVLLLNIWIAYRGRPAVPPRARIDDPVARYRDGIDPIRRPVFLVVGLISAGFAGSVAVGQWQTFQLWWHGTSFGVTDGYFGRDVSFFVFDWPWYRYLASYGFSLLIITTAATALVYYLYGAITPQRRGRRVSKPAQVHLSILIGLFLLLKAFAYWLDKYAFATEAGGVVDGITFTDANARIPSKEILMVIAIICAVLFFANAVRGTWMLPALGGGLLILSSVLMGTLWPAIMQTFQVDPSEPDREGPYIQRNIDATRDAYDISDVETETYDAETSPNPEEVQQSAEQRVSTRILDPTLVAPAFEQLQQVRGFYSVPDALDVDRYDVDGDGEPEDTVVAAREVDLEGLDPDQRSWAADHTVFTHGYGVIAASGTEATVEGEPEFFARGIPPTGPLGDFEVAPRIYFGERSPEYSIVGRPEGAEPIEIDIPQGSSTSDDADEENVSLNEYDGTGGVEMGSLFNQVLYAFKFGEPNLVLSDRVNENSKILYDRVPRDRVEKVAPWLTVDGDSYPAIVDGRVVWIVDAYTTTDRFPLSELRSLEEATSDTLTDTGAQATLPTDEINYMRNSVKAVVDAYDGSVDLYAWDEEDPILQTWMKVFPDVVQSKDEIPEALLEHLRYPVDMFKVQREVLERYHVEDAQTFYTNDEAWLSPDDPTGDADVKQPPYYLSMAQPGSDDPQFSLTTVMVPNNRENLAAFISVNAEASDPEGYGTMQILQLPSNTRVGGPNQVNNTFFTDDGAQQQLLPFNNNDSVAVLYGNLLTLPIGNGLLYAQPVYTQNRDAEGSFPTLQLVIASFGDEIGIGRDLDAAISGALGLEDETDGGTPEPDPEPDPDPGQPGGQEDTIESLLAEASQRFEDAQEAYDNQDLGEYQTLTEEAQDLVNQALVLIEQENGGTDDGTGTDEGTDGGDGTDEAPADPSEESTEPDATS